MKNYIKKTIAFIDPTTVDLATKLIKLGLKNAQDNYNIEHKKFDFYEDKETYLHEKVFEVKISDDRSCWAIIIRVRFSIRIVAISISMETTKEIILEILDDSNPDEQDLQALEYVQEYIKQLVNSVLL